MVRGRARTLGVTAAVLFAAVTLAPGASASPQPVGSGLQTDTTTVEFGADPGAPSQIVRPMTNAGNLPVRIVGLTPDPVVQLGAPFTFSTDCNGLTLAHAESCSFTFSLDRAQLGSLVPVDAVRLQLITTLGLGDQSSNWVEWQVIVASDALVYPNRITFSPSSVGSRPVASLWVYNKGPASLDISDAVAAPDAPFTAGSCALWSVLTASLECAIPLTWKPTGVGDEGRHTGVSTVTVGGHVIRIFYDAYFPSALTVSPDQQLFEQATYGTAIAMTVTITNSSASSYGPFTPTLSTRTRTDESFGTDLPVIEENHCVAVTLAPGGACTFVASVVPLMPGYVSASVDVSVLGFPVGTARIMSTKRAESPLAFAPSPVDFGNVALDTSVVRQVRMANTSQQAFGPIVVHDHATGHQDIVFGDECDGVTLAPGGHCDMSVTAHPTTIYSFTPDSTYQPNKLRFLDVSGFPEVGIAVAGAVAYPAGWYSLTPSSLDYGITPLFGETTRTLTFTNNLAVTLLPQSFDVSEPYWLTRDECTNEYIPAHASCEMDVAFRPVTPPSWSSPSLPPLVVGIGAAAPLEPTTGSVAALSITPDPVDLGAIGLYVPSAPFTVKVHNDSLEPLAIPADALALVVDSDPGAPLQLSLGENTCEGTTVPVGGSCTFDIAALPLAPGLHSATAVLQLDVQRNGGLIRFSEPFTAKANPDPAPEDLTVKSVSGTSASLTWTFDKVNKKWVLIDNGAAKSVTPSRRTNRYTVSVGSLGTGKQHCFALKTSTASKTVSRPTCLVTKPTGLRIRAAGNGAVVLTWQGTVSRYLAVFDDGHAVELKVSVSRAGFNATITGLPKGVRTCFRLVAVGTAASSAPTAKVCVKVK